jgi:hypothetical protein
LHRRVLQWGFLPMGSLQFGLCWSLLSPNWFATSLRKCKGCGITDNQRRLRSLVAEVRA